MRGKLEIRKEKMGGKIFEEGESGGREEKWEKLFQSFVIVGLYYNNKEKEEKRFRLYFIFLLVKTPQIHHYYSPRPSYSLRPSLS